MNNESNQSNNTVNPIEQTIVNTNVQNNQLNQNNDNNVTDNNYVYEEKTSPSKRDITMFILNIINCWFILPKVLGFLLIWFIFGALFKGSVYYLLLLVGGVYLILSIVFLIKTAWNVAKHNNILKIVFFGVLIVCAFSMYRGYQNARSSTSSQKTQTVEINDLTNIINDAPSYSEYRYPNYYFVYKDKLYYYSGDSKSKQNYFYSADTDGKNVQLISSSEELSFPSFSFVYKDEAYFIKHEGYFDSNKKNNYKINLKTGNITDLGVDYTFLPYTLKDGTIMAIGNRNLSDYRTLRKYNLDTNELIYEKTIDNSTSRINNYDMVNGLVYSLNTKFINKELDLEVFKDNKSIGKFKIDDFNAEVKNTNGINYFLADNNELFFADTQYIYKYNINDKKVIKNAFTNDIRKFDNIPSNTNNSYIYSNGSTIYEFDKETLTFNSLFQIPSEKSSGLSSHTTTYWLKDTFIYVSNSKIILPLESNTLKYKSTDDRIGNVYIYDINTRQVEEITNARRAFFDFENNKLYIYSKKTDGNYEFKKIDF